MDRVLFIRSRTSELCKSVSVVDCCYSLMRKLLLIEQRQKSSVFGVLVGAADSSMVPFQAANTTWA